MSDPHHNAATDPRPDPTRDIALVPMRDLMSWLHNRPLAPTAAPPTQAPVAVAKRTVSPFAALPAPTRPLPPRPPAPSSPQRPLPPTEPEAKPQPPDPAPLQPPPLLPPAPPVSEPPVSANPIRASPPLAGSRNPEPGPVAAAHWEISNTWTLPQRPAVLRRPNFSVSPVATPWTPRAPAPPPAAPPVPAPAPPEPEPETEPAPAAAPAPPPPMDLPPPVVFAQPHPASPLPPPQPAMAPLRPSRPAPPPRVIDLAQPAIFAPPSGAVPNPAPSATPEPTPPSTEMPLAAPLAPAVPQDVPLPSGADSSAWSRLTRDIDGDEDDTLFDPPPFPPEPAPPRNWPWRPAALAAAVLLAVGGGTAFVLLQSEPPPPISGVVTGPLLTVFAPVDGRLTHILVSLGTHVSGGTDLFEIEQAPPDPRARSDIAARLDLARTRAARLDQRQRELEGLIQRSRAVGADPVAAREAEAMRQRLGDLQDERGATAGEIALLERSLASDIARNSSLGAKRVKASQSGVIARLQAVEGMEVVPGLPLGQMIDCDHLSIAVDGPAAASLGIVSNRLLHVTLAGSAVTLDVHVPPASARPMRQTASDNAAIAAGGRLSIPLERVALEKAAGEACPVGRSATMSLE